MTNQEIKNIPLDYIRRGWCVIPCRSKSEYDENGVEVWKAKQALVSWKGITETTEAMLDEWHDRFPGCMWAVLTGERSGIWVLDLDVHGENGVEVFKAWCAKHGYQVPKTLTQRTHSGGVQLFFTLPHGRKVKTVARIMPGVDVRGEGGYACIPPSVNHDTGGKYEWINSNAVVEAPDWLLDIVCKDDGPKSTPTMKDAAQRPQGNPSDASAWGRKALEEEIAFLEQTPEGARNTTLNLVACKLGSIVAGGGLDEQEVRAALERAAASIGLLGENEIETLKTINSGLRTGMQNPRMPEAKQEFSIIPGNGRREQQAPPMVGEDEEPMPLRRPPKEQELFPVDALDLFADAVDDIAKFGCIPRSVVATGMLTVMSLVSQRLANVCTRRYQTPLSLFGLTVALPGDGKSEAEAVLMKPIKERERRDGAFYREQMDEYEADLDAWKAEYESVRNSKKVAMEDRREAMRELKRNKPKPPMPPYWVLSNPNVEGLFRFLGEKPYAGIFSDEGGIFLGGTAMNQENAMKTAASLSALWSGGSLDKSRGGEGTSKLFGVRGCMNLMVQPIIAEKVFSDELLSGQGFLFRQLVTWPQMPERTASTMRLEDLPSVQTYYRHVEALLDRPERKTEDGSLVFDELRLTADAEEEYRRFFDWTHSMAVIGEAGEYEPVAGFCKRSAEQALRIAGCLTLMRNAEAVEVGVYEMTEGITLAKWYLSEALRIREDDLASPEILAAETLLKWFADHEVDVTSISQIVRSGPSKLREAEAVKPIMDILTNHGWLVPIPGGAEVQVTSKDRRKCRQAWRVRREFYVPSKRQA